MHIKVEFIAWSDEKTNSASTINELWLKLEESLREIGWTVVPPFNVTVTL